MPRLNIDCLIPAAGLSSRMGSHKLLSDFGGKPLVRWAVDHALHACRRVIIVLGHNADALSTVLPREDRLVVVTNPDYEQGMLTSIARGAVHVSTEFFFVAPADMPFLTPGLFVTVASAAGLANPARDAPPSGPAAWMPIVNGRRGHPVLVSRTVVPALTREVLRDSPPESMRRFLASYDVRQVPIDDDASIIDIDTMAELRRFSPRAGDTEQ